MWHWIDSVVFDGMRLHFFIKDLNSDFWLNWCISSVEIGKGKKRQIYRYRGSWNWSEQRFAAGKELSPFESQNPELFEIVKILLKNHFPVDWQDKL